MPEIPFETQFPTISSFFAQTGGFPEAQENGWFEIDLDDDTYDEVDLNEFAEYMNSEGA